MQLARVDKTRMIEKSKFSQEGIAKNSFTVLSVRIAALKENGTVLDNESNLGWSHEKVQPE